ncbi:MAG: ribonuclease III [Candidatus Vogelbacteria bacterium]|nr:ribonuclease III [Candidatus Vogelbacteria bacterium]
MKPDLTKFTQALDLNWCDQNLLLEAFTHRSYLNEHKSSNLKHNERLEFLGDAVLELAVTNYLYQKYPEKPEGELTALRAALVNANTLSEVAAHLGMNDYLLLSRGEAKDTGRARQYILANTYEAVLGAIYLDQGYDRAAEFVATTLFNKTEAIVADNLWQDAKSLFQERAQEVMGVTPIYKLVRELGPDHNKRFTVGLYLEAEEVSLGEGHSKQEAEQDAAQKGLEVKGWK